MGSYLAISRMDPFARSPPLYLAGGPSRSKEHFELWQNQTWRVLVTTSCRVLRLNSCRERQARQAIQGERPAGSKLQPVLAEKRHSSCSQSRRVFQALYAHRTLISRPSFTLPRHPRIGTPRVPQYPMLVRYDVGWWFMWYLPAKKH